MLQSKCSSCNAEVSLRSCYLVNGQLYCGPCADKAVSQLEATKSPVERSNAIDRTVCYQCNADGGNTEFQTIKNTPFCPACYEKANRRQSPHWLKVALAVLLAVLGFAIIHGIQYFRAGRALDKSDRLVSAGNYTEAIPLLLTAVKNTPDCEKCSLLLAKALLKTGDLHGATMVLKSHNNGRYESAHDLLNEVNAIVTRADKAWDKAEEAEKTYKSKDKKTAAQLMHEAAALYPENEAFSGRAVQIEIETAYQDKNYGRFTELAKEQMRRFPDDAMAIGQYASALACKYAVTGDKSLRAESEQVLQKANSVAMSPAQRMVFAEYDERIRHRLETRLIIEKAEYDRRFHKATNKADVQQ